MKQLNQFKLESRLRALIEHNYRHKLVVNPFNLRKNHSKKVLNKWKAHEKLKNLVLLISKQPPKEKHKNIACT